MKKDRINEKYNSHFIILEVSNYLGVELVHKNLGFLL